MSISPNFPMVPLSTVMDDHLILQQAQFLPESCEADAVTRAVVFHEKIEKEAMLTVVNIFKIRDGVLKTLRYADQRLALIKMLPETTKQQIKQAEDMVKLFRNSCANITRDCEEAFEQLQVIYLAKIQVYVLYQQKHKSFDQKMIQTSQKFLSCTNCCSVEEEEIRAQRACDQLILEENERLQKKAETPEVVKPAKFKKRRPKKTTAPKKTVSEEVEVSTPKLIIQPLQRNLILSELMTINRNPSKSCQYVLQDRVKRWNTADLSAIENFTDFKNGSVVYQYRGLEERELKFQRDSHNVGWAKHLISGPLCAKYAIQDLSTLKDHDKAFYVSMLSEGIRKLGLIVLGIDKDIYHAQYKPFTFSDNVDQDIVDLLKVDHVEQSFEEVEEKKHPNAPWKEITSGVFFSLLKKEKEKEIIEVKVRHGGNKRTKEKATEGDITYFHIYPLR